jgi:hypothetical protein
MVLDGTIRNGMIVLDQPPTFPEGTRVEVALKEKPQPETHKPTLLGLLKFAGTLSDMPSDFAAEHDHYIHGTPKRSRKESP